MRNQDPIGPSFGSSWMHLLYLGSERSVGATLQKRNTFWKKKTVQCMSSHSTIRERKRHSRPLPFSEALPLCYGDLMLQNRWPYNQGYHRSGWPSCSQPIPALIFPARSSHRTSPPPRPSSHDCRLRGRDGRQDEHFLFGSPKQRKPCCEWVTMETPCHRRALATTL